MRNELRLTIGPDMYNNHYASYVMIHCDEDGHEINSANGAIAMDEMPTTVNGWHKLIQEEAQPIFGFALRALNIDVETPTTKEHAGADPTQGAIFVWAWEN